MNRSSFFRTLAFLAGLAAIGWAGAGYLGSNLLALSVTLLIAAFYVVGALELRRFQQATVSLQQALADEQALPQPATGLAPWLDRIHASLRQAVRLRVEGERVALPGPALTPYLTGLLVLLGMLGTFLGMVVTLHGTGSALQSATDLQAVRESLAAPVKGLGLAFGTSLAGIAGSAMLGLLSALCRRERIQAAQLLDARIASTGLRTFTLAHQREESFKLLQAQSQAMPVLIDRLQAMVGALEQQNQAMNERLIAGQEAFHVKAGAAYSELASSVGRSLNESLSESARAAGAVIEPVVERTMAGISSTFEKGSVSLVRSVSTQLQSTVDEVTARLGATLGGVSTQLETTLGGVSDKLEGTLGAVSNKLDATLGEVSSHLRQNLAGVSGKLESTVDAVSNKLDTTLDGVSAKLDTTLDGVSTKLDTTLGAVATKLEGNLASTAGTLDSTLEAVSSKLASSLDEISTQLHASTENVSANWRSALELQQQHGAALAASTEQALNAAAANFETHSANLLRGMDEALAHQQDALAARDEQRLATWSASMQSNANALLEHWQQAGTQNLEQQEKICHTLAQTANDMAAQSQEHARSTIAEIAQLVQSASEAPRLAAEVIAELRQKLSDSMARDNSLLEERAGILQTLQTLLDAVNHAATEQRAAIDSLVSGSAELLQRVGNEFADKAQAQASEMNNVAAQISGSAVEVASLGEAFGGAVEVFGQANDKLVSHLQRIEAALAKSMSRSDEQLDYYVAQAREVVDLSIRSQKQILEDLQQIAANSQSALAAANEA